MKALATSSHDDAKPQESGNRLCARRVRAPLANWSTYLPYFLCRTLSAAPSGTLPSLAQDPPPKTLPFRHACPNSLARGNPGGRDQSSVSHAAVEEEAGASSAAGVKGGALPAPTGHPTGRATVSPQTMISSNTRATRSRYSSPANPRNASLNGGSAHASKGAAAATESPKTFMQKWLEPTVQSKTSFEEDGLVRYGVVENMAPLGSLPKAKKPGNEHGPGVRRIILRPSGTHTQPKAPEPPAVQAREEEQEEAPAEPTLTLPRTRDHPARKARNALSSAPSTPAPSPPRKKLRKSSLAEASEPVVVKDPEDAEYNPKEDAPRRRQSGRVSVATQKAKQSSDTRRGSTSSAKRSAQGTSQAGPRFDQEERDFIDKVVESAVDEALKHYRYPTAWALRSLYDENANNTEFVGMIESVFNQTADADTMEEFGRLMEEKKREGKKDNQGCYYFIPPSTKNRFTPHKPKVAPYGNLVHRAHEETQGETRAAKKVKTSHPSDTPTRKKSSMNGTLGSKRGGSKNKKQSLEDVGGITASARTPSRRRPRRKSASSDSSLSSTESVSFPDGSPAVTRQTQAQGQGMNQSPSARRKGASSIVAASTDGTAEAEAAAAAAVAAKSTATTSTTATTTNTNAKATTTAAAAAAAKAQQNHSKTRTQARSQQQPPSTDGPRLGPITTRGQAKQAMSNTSGSNSPTTCPGHTHSSNTAASSSSPPSLPSSRSTKAADASMPGRLTASELLPPALAIPLVKVSAKAPKDSVPKIHMTDDDDNNDAVWERRRDAQKVTNSYVAMDSSMRGLGGGDDDAQSEARDATPVRKTRKTRHSAVAASATRATRSASKRPVDDSESVASPAPLSPFQADGSSIVGSRAVTPSTLPPAKRPRTGLRIKSSPVKRKGGTAAGVPRPVGEGNPSATNGANKEQGADNDEYCSACGNSGDVVCCDGCPRSFHFECVDMVESETLPDEWFCTECVVRRFPSRVPVHKGVFGAALNNLEKSIPRAFSLPRRLQNRFEGVKAGADGDYEEIATSKVAKKKTGYDELPDFFKQREDGLAVLCHDCQKPATEIRAIIPCSVCPLHWHIDCLDPPLTIPPVLKTWRCPAHVDDVLSEAPPLAPAHRFRKIKGSSPVVPAITRGIKNNGHIQIDWPDEPEEPSASGWPDAQSFGRTYKLPAKSVVLDFIEQLRQQGAGHGRRQNEPKVVPYLNPSALRHDDSIPIRGSSLQRSVEELQLSLNLVSLQQSPTEQVDHLRSALLSNVDHNVLSLMARANADNIASGNLTESDRLGLRSLLVQMDAMSSKIRFLLGDDVRSPSPPDMIVQGTTPISEPPGEPEPLDKADAMPPVTEPTPPSTTDQAEGPMELDLGPEHI
ncbi:hypothetical protein S7711_00314 [Stachybotrys chartarum IBT 7711]|uniref:PHD-type domain-containing protein n=1 Tax=Stachybotrys chartarum (strain CBS 109288 / IBT 7711) TaxID=1280523 RepID=A0A084B9C5_STACB|nr:hypothetical protein S7711_00314 [Stachybotrys chartarum IBT 7711]